MDDLLSIGDLITAPSTNQSSDATAQFGRSDDSGETPERDTFLALPSVVMAERPERGRQEKKEKKERSSRNSSSRSTPVTIKTTTTKEGSRGNKSKSPRSARTARSSGHGISPADLLLDAALEEHRKEKQRSKERSESVPATVSRYHDDGYNPGDEWAEAARPNGSSSSSGMQVVDHVMVHSDGDVAMSDGPKPGCPDCTSAKWQRDSDMAQIAQLQANLTTASQQLELASNLVNPNPQYEQKLVAQEYELQNIREQGMRRVGELEQTVNQQSRQIHELLNELSLRSGELSSIMRSNNGLQVEKEHLVQKHTEQMRLLENLLQTAHERGPHSENALELSEMKAEYGNVQHELSEKTRLLNQSLERLKVAENRVSQYEGNHQRIAMERSTEIEELEHLKGVNRSYENRISELEKLLNEAHNNGSSSQERSQHLVTTATEELSAARLAKERYDKQLEQMAEACSNQTMRDQSEKTLLRQEIIRLKGEVAELRDSRVNNANDSGVAGNSIPTSENDPGTSSGANVPTSLTRSVSPGGAKMITDMFEKFQKELANTVKGVNARLDQFEESRSRGRSSTRDTQSSGNSGTRRVRIPDDPDPDDPDDDDDNSSGANDGGRRDRSRDRSDDDDDDSHDDNGGPVTITVNRRRDRGNIVTETRRTREQDSVKVPNFPTVPTLSAWKIQVGKNLVTASNRYDLKELKWWAEINDESATFESLADSGRERFKSLDLKLSAALGVMLKAAKNQVTERVHFEEMQSFDKGEMLKGRQIAWLILQHFKTNPKMGVFYNVTDIGQVKWRGDTPRQVHTFMMIWKYILHNTKTKIPTDELAEILLTKLEKSNVLKGDIDAYNRMKEDDPDRTYDYLMSSMVRYLDRCRYHSNRELDLVAIIGEELGGGSRKGLPATTDGENAGSKKKGKRARAQSAPAKAGKGEGKKKGKGKGKGKSTQSFREPCYFFNQPGGCNKSAADCKYAHVKLSAEDLAKLPKPGTQNGNKGREGSRSSSPAGKSNDSKPKAEAKTKPRVNNPGYCHNFLKESGCSNENCKYMHLDNAGVEEYKRSQRVLKEITDRKS